MNTLKDREELLRQLPTGSVGAELGVLCGAFSTRILEMVKPSLLHLVDLWMDNWEWMEPDESGNWQVARYSGKEAWSIVHGMLQASIRSGQVQLHCAEAGRWLEIQPAASLDWVYLDDNHSFNHVARELEAASRCVRPGGWILGHDYCPVLPGVVRAVDQFCKKRELRIEFLTDEEPLPVYPRAQWMPESCAYKSFGIRLP